jgi:hypothetical protein
MWHVNIINFFLLLCFTYLREEFQSLVVERKAKKSLSTTRFPISTHKRAAGNSLQNSSEISFVETFAYLQTFNELRIFNYNATRKMLLIKKTLH